VPNSISIHRIKIEESKVRKLLLGINPNKSPGPDGLHPKALKELTNVITEPLTS
jgi:hypothetical protein